eukprot:g30527.t1
MFACLLAALLVAMMTLPKTSFWATSSVLATSVGGDNGLAWKARWNSTAVKLWKVLGIVLRVAKELVQLSIFPAEILGIVLQITKPEPLSIFHASVNISIYQVLWQLTAVAILFFLIIAILFLVMDAMQIFYVLSFINNTLELTKSIISSTNRVTHHSPQSIASLFCWDLVDTFRNPKFARTFVNTSVNKTKSNRVSNCCVRMRLHAPCSPCYILSLY